MQRSRRRTWLNRALLVWAVVTGIAVFAPRDWAAGQDGPDEADPNRAADGRQLYETGCASCHGSQGEGSADAPPLVDVGDAAVDFMLRTGRMPAAFPRDQAAISGAPAYDDAERDRIVAYVRSLGDPVGQGPGIPVVDPASGDLVRGRELFLANCAACHGISASGDTVGEDAVAPSLHDLDPVVIAEAPLVGPGEMPRFDDVLGPEDLDSIVRYVQSTGDTFGPAGLTLDDQGPLMEGLVAGLVGLGGLILMARAVEGVRRPDASRGSG